LIITYTARNNIPSFYYELIKTQATIQFNVPEKGTARNTQNHRKTPANRQSHPGPERDIGLTLMLILRKLIFAKNLLRKKAI
jgi:hypothetical protein